MTTARYDRQIRLWGEEGQTSIAQTSVGVLGSNGVATECLKNLVLAGIKSFHVIDDVLVDETDLGKNFFITEDCLGKPRAEVVVAYLKELNPTVAGRCSVESPLKYAAEKLLDFSIIISTTLSRDHLLPIAQYVYERGVPLIDARVCGLIGYFRLSFKLHTVYQTHNEHPQPDLRLDRPFDSLLKFSAENDLSKMDHEQHCHTPYVLIVLQALDRWRTLIGNPVAFPTVYAERKRIGEIMLEMRIPDKNGLLDEENFTEAQGVINRILMPTSVPKNVSNVFNHVLCKAENLTQENATWFWILAASLKIFVENHGVLPLSGVLPDMTSDSQRYVRLLNLYRTEAERHARELHAIAQGIVLQVYGSNSTEMIPFSQAQVFCKHAAFINVQIGSSLQQENDEGIAAILKRISEPEMAVAGMSPMKVSPLTWLILMKAADNFNKGKNRFPGTNGVPMSIDAEDLAKRVEWLLLETKDTDALIEGRKLIPQEAIDEMCRYGAGEPHVICSIIGGIVSQEAIKLATHQYVPVDNTFVFDGNTQGSETIRL